MPGGYRRPGALNVVIPAAETLVEGGASEPLAPRKAIRGGLGAPFREALPGRSHLAEGIASVRSASDVATDADASR